MKHKRNIILRVFAPITYEDSLLKASYLFMLPALIVYIVIILYPAIFTSILSFFDWNGFSKNKLFVGVQNYIQLFQDDLVLQSLLHNFQFMLGAVFLPMLFGFIAAVLLTQDIHGKLVFRIIYYIPMILPPVATGIIWQWMYSPKIGIINKILKILHLDFLIQPWLGQSETALMALIVVFSWIFFGFSVIISLAALQTVDQSLKEAGKIDGASPLRILVSIVIPSILNQLGFLALYMSILAMKIFNLPFIMTQGGPGYSTHTIATVMYQKAFNENEMGYGAAISTIMLVIVVAVYILSEKIQERIND
jgi:ABC-type sugar transport system permease subunit